MGSMRKSQLSKTTQDRLIEHLVVGAKARCAAYLVSVNPKTAIYYFDILREIIAYHLEQEAVTVFSVEIEVGESYFGWRAQRKARPRCSRKRPGVRPFKARR